MWLYSGDSGTRPSRTEEVEISALPARLLVAGGSLLLAVACAGSPPEPAAAPVSAPTRADAAVREADDSLLRLAEEALARGEIATARERLAIVVQHEPWRSDAHARLADLTGPADRRATVHGRAAVALAEAHPYDPWALLGAGTALAAQGSRAAAIEKLERALWLGDLDPASAAAAAGLLARLSESWRDRPVVPVHLHADESIRAEPGWKFRLRSVLLSTANGLADPLGVRLVAVSVSDFETAGVGADLDSIHAAFTRATGSPPGPGILAGFTGRPLPGGRSEQKRGLAEFLGRRLSVRLPPGDGESRALAHEILHLYGAVHVADAVESLMNPSGESLTLDAPNRRIVHAMHRRSFATGRFDQDVLPHVDLHEVTDAYVAALGANPTFRRLGLDAILAQRQTSPYAGAARGRALPRRDPQLADVAMTLAALMLSDGRRVEALSLFEAASRLYGAGTPRGAEAAQYAQDLRRALSIEHGL